MENIEKINSTFELYEHIGLDGLENMIKTGSLNQVSPIEVGIISRHLQSVLGPVFRSVLKNKNTSILEVGCGNGRLATLLSENCNYYGIDTNREYVSYCKKRIKNGNFEEYDFRKIDISGFISLEMLPKNWPNKFNGILFPWTTINHYSFEDQIEMLKKAKNMLVEYDNESKALFLETIEIKDVQHTQMTEIHELSQGKTFIGDFSKVANKTNLKARFWFGNNDFYKNLKNELKFDSFTVEYYTNFITNQERMYLIYH